MPLLPLVGTSVNSVNMTMKNYTHQSFRSIAVCILLLALLPFSSAAYAIAGRFQFVNGDVVVLNVAGKQRPAKKGEAIDEGETVSSLANGFAQIKMEDGGYFAVRADTQFKVDTFKFQGKDDGSERGLFTLIKGSLRSITGLIGKKHKDNYKIQTATSTIGIRGSGADIGHDTDVGTAVRTLFGGHSLTSHGQTIETRPGQTALAAPGQPPAIVLSFPFSTNTAPASAQHGNNAKSDGGNTKSDTPATTDTSNSTENTRTASSDSDTTTPVTTTVTNTPTTTTSTTSGLTTAPLAVVIPLTTTTDVNLTTNTTSSGTAITTSGTPTTTSVPFVLPTGDYFHYVTALKQQTSGGVMVVEQGTNSKYYPSNNYTFDSNGNLVEIASSNLRVYDASSTPVVQDTPSSFVVTGGSWYDTYHTPDNSIFIARGSNTVVNTNCAVCNPTDTFISMHSVILLATAPAFVQTITGSANYILAGSTSPTDSLGNVGTLNSAYINANFTNQTVDFGLNLSIANKTLNAAATGIAIVGDGFEAKATSLPVTCTGAGCGTGYTGSIGGAFAGNAGATAAMGYDFFPTSNVSGNFTDYIHGVATFTANSTPTATPSVIAALGSGGAVAGDLNGIDPLTSFAIVGSTANGIFSARNNTSGSLIAFNTSATTSSDTSFSLGIITPFKDGSDAAQGVVWGRWAAGYNVNQNGIGTNLSLAPTGELAFITGAHITTAAELANYTSWTGSGLSAGNTIGTYSLATGMGNFPTILDGMTGGGITSASATVDFSTNQITSLAIGGGTTGGFGSWSAAGAGSINNFMSGTGIALSGTCAMGSGSCVSSTGAPITGVAKGGFVGTQAQGIISSIGLKASGGEKLGGVVYLKR